jgi:enoyl-CoA hydratase
MQFSTIIYEIKKNIAYITLNRPKALNALNAALMSELAQALHDAEAQTEVHVIVIKGGAKAFAAGADLKELMNKDLATLYLENFIAKDWEEVSKCRKPVIAAVAGLALGGGCELALMCDLVIAGRSAKFGLPELSVGTIPGAGGTQRMTRIAGKAKAMDMCLTGRFLSAEEADVYGLISRCVDDDELDKIVDEVAAKVAGLSQPIAYIAKEAIKTAEETSLSEGLHMEKRLLYSTFSFEDRKEGMTAFSEKRAPEFRHK